MGWRGSNSHPTVPRTVSFSLSEVLSGAFTPGRGLPPAPHLLPLAGNQALVLGFRFPLPSSMPPPPPQS